jgi:hypothetical protein
MTDTFSTKAQKYKLFNNSFVLGHLLAQSADQKNRIRVSAEMEDNMLTNYEKLKSLAHLRLRQMAVAS